MLSGCLPDAFLTTLLLIYLLYRPATIVTEDLSHTAHGSTDCFPEHGFLALIRVLQPCSPSPAPGQGQPWQTPPYPTAGKRHCKKHQQHGASSSSSSPLGSGAAFTARGHTNLFRKKKRSIKIASFWILVGLLNG